MNTRKSSSDKFSNLPSSIIENILCLVPIKEAARTSILSKEWRYKWINIPKLVFKEHKFALSTNENQHSAIEQRKKITREAFFYAVYKVLLVHQGPIFDFTLVMDTNETNNRLFLRKNSVKRLKLNLNYSGVDKLPKAIFSLHQLTHLNLQKGYIYHEPPLSGFGNLTNLYLNDVKMPTRTLLHLVSSCPLLKSLTLLMHKDNILGDEQSTFVELFECLSVIEKLTTSSWITRCFILDAVPQQPPTSLANLKVFCLEQMCLFDQKWLPFVFLLIKCSPNMEKIVLEMYESSATDPGHHKCLEEDPFSVEEYTDIWLGNLNELEIDCFVYMKLHLDFVKLIMAKSPMLKTMSIGFHEDVSKNEELKILEVLLSCPRASPLLEILVERYA